MQLTGDMVKSTAARVPVRYQCEIGGIGIIGAIGRITCCAIGGAIGRITCRGAIGGVRVRRRRK